MKGDRPIRLKAAHRFRRRKNVAEPLISAHQRFKSGPCCGFRGIGNRSRRRLRRATQEGPADIRNGSDPRGDDRLQTATTADPPRPRRPHVRKPNRRCERLLAKAPSANRDTKDRSRRFETSRSGKKARGGGPKVDDRRRDYSSKGKPGLAAAQDRADTASQRRNTPATRGRPQGRSNAS